jgi:hypothetical protein
MRGCRGDPFQLHLVAALFPLGRFPDLACFFWDSGRPSIICLIFKILFSFLGSYYLQHRGVNSAVTPTTSPRDDQSLVLAGPYPKLLANSS